MKTLDKIPTSKIQRASKLISTGAKVGVNYLKYYGEKIIDPKYGRVFGPMRTDRLILRKDGIEDDYIILHVDIRTFNYVELSDYKKVK